MRYGSVCSGIEAATVAWHPLGWEPVFFSEIERFPRAVLKHRQQAVDAAETDATRRGVPLWGDFTALRVRHFKRLGIEVPELLVGGTPCQAFSLAGKRGSLSDDRGNLTLQYVRLANAIDNVRRHRGERPLVIVWENVPGVLSTQDNAFGCFLAGIVGADSPLLSPYQRGRWPDAGMVVGPRRSAAWRVLDAQHFGLAQRRRRVFVVAGAGDEFNPGAVLFESRGLRRDSAPGWKAGAGVAGATNAVAGRGSAGGAVNALSATGVGTCGADDNQAQAGHLVCCEEVSATLKSGSGDRGWNADDGAVLQEGLGTLRALEQDSHENLLCMATGQGSAEIVSDGEPSLTCNHEAPIVVGTICKDSFTGGMGGRPEGAAAGHVVAHTLRGEGFDASEDGSGRGTSIVPVAFNLRGREGGAMAEMAEMASIRAASGGSSRSYVATTAVRRLTCRECERLQGFKDDYTLIPWSGKRSNPQDYAETVAYLMEAGWPEEEARALANTPDGPRYKAIGNSMATTCMQWIGRRLGAVVNGLYPM